MRRALSVAAVLVGVAMMLVATLRSDVELWLLAGGLLLVAVGVSPFVGDVLADHPADTDLGGRLNVGPANRAIGDVSNGERQASSSQRGSRGR